MSSIKICTNYRTSCKRNWGFFLIFFRIPVSKDLHFPASLLAELSLGRLQFEANSQGNCFIGGKIPREAAIGDQVPWEIFHWRKNPQGGRNWRPSPWGILSLVENSPHEEAVFRDQVTEEYNIC